MGALAGATRGLVGGRDLNGFQIAAPSVEDAARLYPIVRARLDEYDALMRGDDPSNKVGG